ncbi:MAG: HAD family phosphatase [Campylobacterales bacterium]|nr:HAD family phosphatase [Campylobacterales bacterium]
MNKKYILFDNDGVLVETEMWYYEANVKTLKDLGYDLPFDTYMRMMAEGRTTWEQPINDGYTPEEILKFRAIRDDYYQEFLKTKDIEIEGIEEILKELSKNYKMGIVTTSRRVDFEIIHNPRNIVQYMDFVLCEEDYPRAKPFPDPYLKGLDLFGGEKHEAIVIEDSERGLTSAYRAEIDCVIVHNEFTKTHDFSKATYKIQKLSDLINLLK